MNNTKRFVFVSLSILLIVALFVAMVCSFFLLFGEEEVFAEVSSLQIDTSYYLDYSSFTSSTSSSNIPTSFTSMTNMPCSGSWSYDNTTIYFTSCSSYFNTISNITYFSFTFSSDGSYSTSLSVRVIFNRSTHLVSFSRYQIGSSTEITTPTLNNSSIIFTSLPVDSSSNPSWFYPFFLEVVLHTFSSVNVSHTPEIHLFANCFNNVVYDAYDFVNDEYYYDITYLDNYIFFDSSDFLDTSSTFTTLNFRCFSSANQNVYSDTLNCVVNNGLAWFSLSLPDTNISKIFFYYTDYENDGVMYDVEDSNGYILLWRDNYSSLNDSYTDIEAKSIRDNYLNGYNQGINTDKTLLSVMWQTFNLPFRLLFGTYDENPLSSTYQTYVGGLFNFTLLGVDLRGFCIGIMSFAIILAIVRLILGMRGN